MSPVFQRFTVVIFIIMTNDGSGSDMDSLPDLDDLLVSSFDANIPNNEEGVGGQEDADSLGLEPNSYEPFLSGGDGADSESNSQTVTIRI